jgi:hypothetical protein
MGETGLFLAIVKLEVERELPAQKLAVGKITFRSRPFNGFSCVDRSELCAFTIGKEGARDKLPPKKAEIMTNHIMRTLHSLPVAISHSSVKSIITISEL